MTIFPWSPCTSFHQARLGGGCWASQWPCNDTILHTALTWYPGLALATLHQSLTWGNIADPGHRWERRSVGVSCSRHLGLITPGPGSPVAECCVSVEYIAVHTHWSRLGERRRKEGRGWNEIHYFYLQELLRGMKSRNFIFGKYFLPCVFVYPRHFSCDISSVTGLISLELSDEAYE